MLAGEDQLTDGRLGQIGLSPMEAHDAALGVAAAAEQKVSDLVCENVAQDQLLGMLTIPS